MDSATMLLISSLAWPVIIFVLVMVLLISQRKAVGGLIDRLKSLSYPGGQAELSSSLPESSVQAISTLVDVLPANLRESLAAVEGDRARTGQESTSGPAQNREPMEEVSPVLIGDVVDLVVLRTKLENLLSELADPPPPDGLTTIARTTEVLLNRGVVDSASAKALRDTVDIADQAAAGAAVPHRLAVAVANSGPAILEQLSLLRSIAAARFEEHVLEVLQQELPRGWSVETDAEFDSPEDTSDDPKAVARVDALVKHGAKRVVVEVRARVHTGSRRQLDMLRDWLAALPPHLPVLLVLLGSGLAHHELRKLRSDRAHPIDVLLWDTQADALIPKVQVLSGQSRVDSGRADTITG
ncbi:hypothetical protein F0L68_01705 [Solihabitans fulvus]|uniref:Uncharacterized protein n=1 Tax=Solihabitans fulvus TaxID=1892852 RepID=A0A5B2XTJ5_9PSEU|nr:hypothetical protein [Solihabitans fulvus]KAA2266485.1 hypothetical protein F0L68_01705 [Solihabitans fulvus]